MSTNSVNYGLLVFLVSLFVTNSILVIGLFHILQEEGISILLILLYENFVIAMQIFKCTVNYIIYLINQSDGVWEEREQYVYYVEFVTEFVIELSSFCHFLHIWYHVGLNVSLIDLLLAINLRSVIVSLPKRVGALRKFRQTMYDIRSLYEDATKEELAQIDDKCAICREAMTSAKRLPCGHVLHQTCLQQWIKYRRICPICKYNLADHTALGLASHTSPRFGALVAHRSSVVDSVHNVPAEPILTTATTTTDTNPTNETSNVNQIRFQSDLFGNIIPHFQLDISTNVVTNSSSLSASLLSSALSPSLSSSSSSFMSSSTILPSSSASLAAASALSPTTAIEDEPTTSATSHYVKSPFKR